MSEATTGRLAKAAVLRQVGSPLTIEQVEVAEPREDEVLVRLAGVGVCHTDIACRDGFPVPVPIVLGHEGAGVVEQVGSKVDGLWPGDKVVLAFNACGQCRSCTHSRPASCHQFLPFNFAGVRLVDGSTPLAQNGKPIHGNFFGQSSFASYAIARSVNTIKVSSSLPIELLGPLGCGVMTGAGSALNSLQLQPGQSLAIFGGGTVGLSALLGARAGGASKVIVIEPNAKRRALALDLGAVAALDPRDGSDMVAAVKEASDGGVDLALDTTAISAVVGTAINCVLPGGSVGLVGIPAPDAAVPVSLLDLLVKNVSLKSIVEGDANPKEFIPRLLALQAQGKFPFERLITKFPFDEINAAMHAAERGEVVKPVLTF
jgi:Zn-dependent alcohol dehydrogenase